MQFAKKSLALAAVAGFLALAPKASAGFAPPSSLAPFLPAANAVTVSKLMTVGSYIIATEPLGAERARALIANNAAVCDTNWILDYFRLSRDHRLLFGGRVNYSGVDLRGVGPATSEHLLEPAPIECIVEISAIELGR